MDDTEYTPPTMSPHNMVKPLPLGGEFVELCNTLQSRFVNHTADDEYVYRSIVTDEFPFEIVGVGSSRVACRYVGDMIASDSYVVKLSYGNENTIDDEIEYEGELQSQFEAQFINDMFRVGDMFTCSLLAPLYIPQGVSTVTPEYSWVMMKEYPLLSDVYPHTNLYQVDNCLKDVIDRYQLDMGARNVGVDFSWSDTYSVENPPPLSNEHAFCRSVFFIDYGLFEEYLIG